MLDNSTPINAHIFEDFKIGPLTLKNRIMMGPVCTGLESKGKFSYLARFYQQRASGGVSMIVVGGFAFNRIGAFARHANVFHKNSQVIQHRMLTTSIHEKGAHCLLQLTHAGAQSPSWYAMSASPFIDSNGKKKAHAMPAFFIERTIRQCVHTAMLAKKSGYDGVEIEAGGNRLLNSFLTPALNQREDDFGGSLENRLRVISEIVERIKLLAGKDFVVGCRLSLMDFCLKGKDWEETTGIVKSLERQGVDYFAFTLGTSDIPIPTYHGLTPEGVWNKFLDMISEETSKPVVYGFNLFSPSIIDGVLEKNEKAVVELTQALITDANWLKKVQLDRERMIIGCTKCYEGCNGYLLKKGECISCMMNPLMFDTTSVVQKSAEKKKSVLVIGAGPSGMAAAVYAARRGHNVTIYEERSDVGGQILFAAQVPGKKDYIRLVELLHRMCERYDVTIETNHKVVLDEVDEIRLTFDEVIVATGMNPEFLDIRGMSFVNVFPYPSVFQHQHKPMGKRIAVFGNNRIAMDCALHLLHTAIDEKDHEAWLNAWGVGDPRKHRAGIVGVMPQNHVPEKEITLLSAQNEDFANSFVSTWRQFETRWLRILGISAYKSVNVEKYEIPTMHITFGKQHENPTTLQVDNVIIADKLIPENTLAQQFEKAGLKAFVIGAANTKPGYHYLPLIQCIMEGIAAGNKI